MALVEANGLQFNVEVAGDGFPLVLLHGFTGSAATWRPFETAWPGFRTVAIDLIGHGVSAAPDGEARYSMEHCVADVAALIDTECVGRAAVLGYSMGGRVALHLALAAPERVAMLVLEGASTGIEDAAERASRVASDRALADDIERDGLEAFVDRWEAVPLFATQSRLPDSVRQRLRQQRLRNRTVGLANSLRGMGAGAQQPVLGRLRDLTMPVLLIAGEDDVKYRTLARTMGERIPGARVEIVGSAGHAAHFEQPAAFAPLVKEFLIRCLQQSKQPESSVRP